jgi:hypothetical protein
MQHMQVPQPLPCISPPAICCSVNRFTILTAAHSCIGTVIPIFVPFFPLHCPLQAEVVVGSMLVGEVGQVASSTTQPSPPHLAPPTLCLWELEVLVLCLRQPMAPLVPTPRLTAWWRSVEVVDSPQVGKTMQHAHAESVCTAGLRYGVWAEHGV